LLVEVYIGPSDHFPKTLPIHDVTVSHGEGMDGETCIFSCRRVLHMTFGEYRETTLKHRLLVIEFVPVILV